MKKPPMIALNRVKTLAATMLAVVREAGSFSAPRARSRSAVLRAIARAVDAPEFFGNDFDALYDCLCDAVIDQEQGLVLWLFKLHSGDPALAEDAQRITSICADVVTFARENNRSFTYVVEHAGKHPDPEPGVAAAPYGEG